MSKYQQLIQEQRYQIYSYSKIGYSQSKIALEIAVHKSTISRELNKNSGLRGYSAKQAQVLSDKKRADASSIKS
jgi:IS30 family transposase